MGNDLDKIQIAYDLIAEEYAEASLGEHEKKPKDREILCRFSREIGDRRPVWDYGCGSGQTSEYLRRLGIEVSGLDISEQLIEKARETYADIHFEKGNILELDCESDSIAGVVAFYAIVHFTEEQVRIAFREVLRVLQPGGTFLFTYHIGKEAIHIGEYLGKKVDLDLMFFSTDLITSSLMAAGYEQIEIIEREPYPGVEYQSRRGYSFARKPLVPKKP